MSITETVLIFAGIPAAVILVVYAAVYSTTARRGDKRYRPGRPFRFAPVWFVSQSGVSAPAGSAAALPSGHAPTALPSGTKVAGKPAQSPTAQHGDVGGASDSW